MNFISVAGDAPFQIRTPFSSTVIASSSSFINVKLKFGLVSENIVSVYEICSSSKVYS